MPHAPAWGAGERRPIATKDQTSTTTSWSSATTSRTSRRKPRRRFPPEVLSDAEVRALLDACPGTHTGVRNRALLALLYRGGLRLGEALKLRPKDLDLEHGAVRVLHAKGGYSRTAGIDPGAAAEVARWLALRGTWSLPPLTPAQAAKILAAAGTEATVRGEWLRGVRQTSGKWNDQCGFCDGSDSCPCAICQSDKRRLFVRAFQVSV